MSACPSRLELSRWEPYPEPARPPALVEHVGACRRCSAVFTDIAEARYQLLGDDPAEASARAPRAILAAALRSKARRSWWRFLLPALLVPATAVALLLVKPALGPHHGNLLGSAVKGRLIVETYCKRGEQVFPAADGAEFVAGDRLRFAYSQDRPGFLTIFGVDDRGGVFPYYPEHTLVGIQVEAGARVLLPGSVELDHHQGWERVFAIWSERSMADDVVRASVAAALSAAAGDIRNTSTLDLPVEQVSLLLRRP